MSDTTDIVARLSGMSADHGPDGWPAVRMRDITALCEEVTRLRAALAQAGAGREPVAEIVTVRHFHEYDGSALEDTTGYLVTSVRLLGPEPTKEGTQPLYFGAADPSPAQREPLSDAEIAALHNSASACVQFLQPATVRQIARAIERAHGIATSGTKGAARTEDTAPGAGERDNVAIKPPERSA